MRKTQLTKIDTEIRHVTEPGTNIFSELGFPPEEAARYASESREKIDYALALKEQLMSELANWIVARKLRQSEAAAILHVTRPRVSDVVNKKTSKFTVDALVDMLAYAGKEVTIIVR